MARTRGAGEAPAGAVDEAIAAAMRQAERLQHMRSLVKPNGSAPVSASDPRILSGAAFVEAFEPPDWLIDGLVQRGRLYACTSLTGHGKTAVWLYNACMIHTGRKVGDLETVQGNVLILAGENPEDLKARMLGMMRTFNLKASELPYVLPGQYPMDEDGAKQLHQDIERLGVPLVLIIADTASSFFPGEDENSNVQAGGYARTARELTTVDGNPAVMFLCHPVKNASKDNLLPRGGGAFLNELDGNFTLWSAEEGETTALHWQGKLRGADFEPVAYALRQVPTGRVDKKARPVDTIIARPIDDMEVANRIEQRDANDDAVLRAICDNPKWSMAAIATHLGWFYEDGRPNKSLVQRTVRRLDKDKLVKHFRGKWEATELGKKEAKIVS